MGGVIKPGVTSGLAWKGRRGWGRSGGDTRVENQAVCCVFLKVTFFGCAVSLREDKSLQKRCIDKWIMRQENRILYRSPHTSTAKNNLMRGIVALKPPA